jgi:putative bacteriocin precursor
MKKLGKKFHETKETIESYTCYCSCNCNPTTCGSNTSAIANTGSSNVGYNTSTAKYY